MTQRKIGDVILDVQNISLSFGGVKALTDISFDVREHEIRSIIGPNGAGMGLGFNLDVAPSSTLLPVELHRQTPVEFHRLVL